MKHIFLFFLFFSCTLWAQKGEAVLIFKDSTRVTGYGEISGITTSVSIKFSNDTLKYKRYKPKEIIGMDLLENDYLRKFRYKYVDKNRFPELLEVIGTDSLSLYVRVYEPKEIFDSTSFDDLNEADIGLQGKGFDIDSNFSVYLNIRVTFARYSYYVGNGHSDRVEHLYSKGLPFSSGFKKAMVRYFKDCPELTEKVNNKEFSNDGVMNVVSFYNRECLNSRREQ